MFSIRSDASGKLLDLRAYNAGAQVVQMPYLYGSDSQQWQQIPVSYGVNKYRNVATGLYLDVQGSSYAAGAPLVQWYGTNGLNQIFTIY